MLAIDSLVKLIALEIDWSKNYTQTVSLLKVYFRIFYKKLIKVFEMEL